MSKPTLENQIARIQRRIDLEHWYSEDPLLADADDAAVYKAILVSLKRLQSIEDAKMPEEPPALTSVRRDISEGYKAHWKPLVDYIDDLLAFAQAERQKRLDAEARVGELEMDAERYRWLRENTGWANLYENCGIQGSDIKIMVSRKRLDSSIDAVLLRDQAMNAEKETK